MKKFAKALYYFTERIIQTIISIINVLLFSKIEKQGISYLEQGIKNKDKCYVLGTGPSLKEDISYIRNECTNSSVMTLNNFYKDNLFYQIKPNIHIIIDPGYYRTEKKGGSICDQDEFIKQINNINWKIYMVVPIEFKHSPIYKRISNKSIKFIFINLTPIEGIKSVSYILFQFNLGMPFPQNVLNAAIFCAIQSRFKNIYIYGADHSWAKDVFVYDNNKVCYVEDHFYNEENKYHEMIGFTISNFYAALSKVFKSHAQLRKYADYKGCKIVNCTKKSFIDAYERK